MRPSRGSRWELLQTLAFYIPSGGVALFALVGMLRRTMTFDADGLWLFSFVHDIRLGTPLGGWAMPGAPLYFPELISVLTWTSLHLSAGGTLLVHGLVSWLFVGGAIAWAFRLAGSSWRVALEAAFLALLSYIFAYGNSNIVAAFQFPVAHGGATLAALIGLVFLGQRIQAGYGWRTAMVATTFIGVMVASDRAVLGQFVTPAAFSAGLLLASHRTPRRNLLWTIGILTSGAALGWGLTYLIRSTLGIEPTPLGVNTTWVSASETGSLMLGELLALAHQQPLVLASVLLPSGVLLFVASTGFLRHRQETDSTSIVDRPALFRWWLACATLMTMVATLAGPLVTHRWAPRYVLPIFILPLAFSIVVLGPRIEALGRRTFRGIQLGMLAIVAVLAAGRTNELAPLNPYAAAHACLDRLAYQHGLSAGHAEYWQARPAMVLGQNRLTISAVSAGLMLRRWMDNAFWYSRGYDDTERPPRYDFVIANGMDTAWLQSRFGAPRAIERCFGPEVWIYDRATDVEFRNFVRTRIARETGDHDGWWESSTLTRARFEGRTGLDFDGGEGQLVEFARAGPANVIEISCPTQQPLDVRYQLNGQEIARQAVDFRRDKRRILSMPEAAARHGFDSLRLHGLAGVRYEVDDIALMLDTVVEPRPR